MAYELFTIRQFENAMFKGDRSVMDDETFNIVFNEYIDKAKLYETEQFAKVTYIHYLSSRNNIIKLAIKLQREFVKSFGEPCVENFDIFKSRGISIKWDGDLGDFLELLSKIEKNEMKFVSELENCIKDLMELKKRKTDKEISETIRRESWMMTIITLLKIGYKIDKDKETVEELALMILNQTEENKS